MKRSLLAVLLALMAVSSSVADEKPLTVTVTGGAIDLHNVVIRVPISARVIGNTKKNVRLQEVGAMHIGQVVPGRLLAKPTGRRVDAGEAPPEIEFVIMLLKANETRTFKLLTVYPQEETPVSFEWKDAKGDHADLLYGKNPRLRYMYAALDESSKEKRDLTYKMYHHAFDPTGTLQLTKGPGGLYPHHRGLFFGFNRVSYGMAKADTWHCTGDAHLSHEEFVNQQAGELLGRHRMRIHWHGEKKHVFAIEERELTAYRTICEGYLIEFATVLKTTEGRVQLDGDPQHAGFHFRASNEVAEQSQAKKPLTYFLRPDGKDKLGATRNWDPKTKKGPVNQPWNAMSFVVDGQRYTAVYLDHPDNPKEARSSERDYGRFGTYFEFDLTEEKPLRLRYRVWIQPGEMTVEQCERLSQAFVTPIKVTLE